MNQPSFIGNTNPKAANKHKRLQQLLQLFPSLPDEALVPIDLIRLLSNRAISSIRRDITAGRLAPPTHIGNNCSRWPASEVRRYLSGV